MKKHMIKTTAAFLLMLIATTMNSCVKGDKGDTGPIGATGAQGPQGNANVHAGTVTIGYSDWVYDVSLWEYSSQATYAQITQDVVNNGMVSAFLSNDGGSSWIALPATAYFSSTESFQIGFKYHVGGVTFTLDFSDGSTIGSGFPTYEFKVVAIGGSQRKAHPNTNWKDYNEVMAVVNESASKTN